MGINDPIKDDEFDLYLKRNWEHQLEDELLKSTYGKRIKALEELGIGMTFMEAVEKYNERFGISFDVLGNVKLEDEDIGTIYKENIVEISKEIGFDISGLEIRQISQVLAQIDYVQDVGDIKIDGIAVKDIENGKLKANNQKEVDLTNLCKKFNIKESEYSLDKNSMKRILGNLGISENQIDKYIRNYEKSSIDTFLNTFSDVNLIRGLSIISDCIEYNKYDNLNIELEEFERQISLYKDSKYWKDITNESGNLDFEKAMNFFKGFRKERESVDLTNKLNRYSTKRELNIEDKKELVEIFLVGFHRGNETQINNIIGIAKTNKIDIFDNKGNLDRDKIEAYGKIIYGRDFDSKEILEKTEFKGETALTELDRIEKCISRGQTIKNPQSVEEINKVKEESKRIERRLCSKKEEIVFNVLNSQNALNIQRDFYKNPKNAKQLILLLCKFREDEIKDNNKKSKRENVEFNIHSVNTGRQDSISGIIKKFILEHRENFEEYLKSDGSFDAKKVLEVFQENELDANRYANNLVAYEQIKSRTDEIEVLERDSENKVNLNKVGKLLNKSKNIQLSEEEKKELYSLAQDMPIDVFSTEMLETLSKLDESKFEEAFKGKKVERKVGKDSLSAIYFSAAKLFVKGVYILPKMLMNKGTRMEYIPKIRNHVVSGAKRIRNVALFQNNDNKEEQVQSDKKNGFKLQNIFKRKDNKLLESGKGETIESSIQGKALSSSKKAEISADKATNSQQIYEEPNIFGRSKETVGCDVGVAENMKNNPNPQSIPKEVEVIESK